MPFLSFRCLCATLVRDYVDHERWYHRGVFLVPALAALARAPGYRPQVTFNIKIAVPLYTGGLFLCCIFCPRQAAEAGRLAT